MRLTDRNKNRFSKSQSFQAEVKLYCYCKQQGFSGALSELVHKKYAIQEV